jgi:hypothetical protein
MPWHMEGVAGGADVLPARFSVSPIAHLSSNSISCEEAAEAELQYVDL